MIGLVIAMHLIVCALLIIIILIQAGRGGGLVESFSGVESMFGPKTNTFLTRATTILASLFFLTCISLAFLSARQSRSLMRSVKPQTLPASEEAAKPAEPKQEAVKPESPREESAPAPIQPQAKPDAPKAQ